MAARADLLIDRGDTFEVVFDYTDSAGAVIDLTGYTATAEFREDARDLAAVLTVTPTVDAAAGRVTLALTSAQTETLTAPRYAYKVRVIATGGEPKHRIVEGTAVMNP